MAFLAFCFTMLSWGMWLGVGNECWIPGNIAPDYSSSFWLAVSASVFSFLALLGAYAVLAMGNKGGGKARGFGKKGKDHEGDRVKEDPEFAYPSENPLPRHGEAVVGDYPQGDMAPPNTPQRTE